MSELSQKLREQMLHDAAYAVEILEETCALYVEELELAQEHLLAIKGWLVEKQLGAIDNLADYGALTIATRLKAILKYKETWLQLLTTPPARPSGGG